MFPTHSTYGFSSAHPQPRVFFQNSSYVQHYFPALPCMPGGWYSLASEHEASPWSWQWSGETRAQEGLFTSHSYTATITQPRVQPTYGMEPVPASFSRIVGGPVSNTNRLEVACPRPIYPLPKWIDTRGWEEDEEQMRLEEGQGRPNLTPSPASPSYIISPDPEELPAPFFPPSPCTHDSLSPDACELPQPRFDSDPRPPVPATNSWPSAPRFIPRPSSWYDPLEPIVFPDPEDLPPPNFQIYARFEIGVLEHPGPPDRHQDRIDERTRDHSGRRGLGEDLWKVGIGGRRMVSGPGHRHKWHDLAWGS